MIMQYQGLNVILNTAELIAMAILAAVFLYNRMNISEQYKQLIARLDRLIVNTSRISTRGKKEIN